MREGRREGEGRWRKVKDGGERGEEREKSVRLRERERWRVKEM